jgi:hypothetical protein
MKSELVFPLALVTEPNPASPWSTRSGYRAKAKTAASQKVGRVGREVDGAPGHLEGRQVRVEKHGHIEYDAEGGAAAKSPEEISALLWRW